METTQEEAKKELTVLQKKEELANELGLRGYLKRANYLKRLTNLVFKPIDEKGIKKLVIQNMRKHPITSRKLFYSSWKATWGFALVSGPLCIIGAILTFASIDASTGFVLTSIGLGAYIVGAGVFLAVYYTGGNIVVSKMDLEDWRNEIPYGAMLSVKEAKERELRNFEIHYPHVAEREEPVITAYENEIMVKVCDWDVGQIFDEAGSVV